MASKKPSVRVVKPEKENPEDAAECSVDVEVEGDVDLVNADPVPEKRRHRSRMMDVLLEDGLHLFGRRKK